jgi:prepilin-type N-terminal cleavage/methylation domain-containing protein
MIHSQKTKTARAGFTLIEALVVVAIIGIMAALVISAYSTAASDSNRITARQQQAALQAATIAWINGNANRVDVNASTGAVNMRTMSEIMTAYNNLLTSEARMNTVAAYLDPNTASMFQTSTTNSGYIESPALLAVSQALQMPTWSSGSYPNVNMVAAP